MIYFTMKRIFKTPEELEKKAQEYFDNAETYAISALALYLGFESRQSLYDYEKMPEYSYIIKRSRLTIEAAYEIGLRSQTVTGCIFALKNMGWTDKSEIEQTVTTQKAPSIVLETE